MECVGRGFESHMSVAFSSKKKLSQVLCYIVLLCLSIFLSIHATEV